jgi:delta 1-pyrroline-5-carboxylate dehydrogenase
MLGIGRRSAMDDVWGPVPEGTEIPERDEFEIVVTPEEPDEIVTTAEENLERQLEEAREVARGDILAWAVGTWTPRSEVRMWHPVFREAYETEFERLKAERLRVTGAAP